MTQPQYMVMVLLWERSPRTIKELSSELSLDHGTRTPLLKRLEANGNVGWRRRTDDERSVDIELTPQGLALEERAQRVPEGIARALHLSVRETTQLRVLLAKMASTTDAAPTV